MVDMSTWLGSLFGSARPAGPTVEQEARQVSSEVDATVGELQRQYEDQADMIAQLGANVKRFHDAGKVKEAARTFREMQQLQKRQDILGNAINIQWFICKLTLETSWKD